MTGTARQRRLVSVLLGITPEPLGQNADSSGKIGRLFTDG